MGRSLLGVILLLPVGVLHAQPASPTTADRLVSVGGVSLRIPVPKGFVDPATAAPELRALGEQFTPPTNRLLVNFVRSSDLRRFVDRRDADLDQYLLVQTARRAENQLISKADFSKLKTAMRQQQGDIMARMGPKLKDLLAQVSKEESRKSGTALSLQIGEVVPLGIFAETDSSLIFGYLSRVSLRGGALEHASTMVNVASLIAPKSKVVFLYIYTTFQSPKDIEWAKKVGQEWTAQVLAAN